MNQLPHGARSKLPEYHVWQGMCSRCNNPKHVSWKNYGGRGIRVAPEWLGPEGFARFYAYVGPRPSADHELDRIERDGHYEPGNVRWLPSLENNRRRQFGLPRALTDCPSTRLTLGVRKLRRWLQEEGISLFAFSKRAGVDRFELTRVLSGQPRVSVDLAMRCAEALPTGLLSPDEFGSDTVSDLEPGRCSE